MQQRPSLNTVLPQGGMMPGGPLVFPNTLLQNAQPLNMPQQNVVLNRPMHYQQLWKN
jgi:hypothetical protein